MSVPFVFPHKPESAPLAPGEKAVRPRAAATVMIVRRDGPQPRVLMGRRGAKHAFMPNKWVFPGGRLDRTDFRAPHATELRPDVAAVFQRHLPARRGRALAMAAIRETYEEAGLLIAHPASPRPAAGAWREFLAEGAMPDLSALDIVSRAITPPHLAKRFDTWFFMVDAESLVSLERRPDTGELDEIAWVAFDEAVGVELPQITRVMLTEAIARTADSSRPRPFLRFSRKVAIQAAL